MKTFKEWFMKTFCINRILMENILMELRGIHYHLDRMEIFYKMVNNIEEDEEKITIGDIVIRKNKTEGGD